MLRSTLAALLLLGAAAPAAAQAPSAAPEPIRPFDLATVERFGRDIWRHDQAASRATDALLKQVADPAKEKIVGWLVDEARAGERVRFLRDVGSGPEAAYDIAVPPRGEPRVDPAAQRTLSAEDLARFRAKRTAAATLTRACRGRYNTVVLKDPDGDGWLVWLLAPSPAAGAIPVGGHYRVTVSADGGTAERRDALSTTCLVVDSRQGLPKGATPVGAVVSHIVSPTPVETHVFLHHLYGLPMYVSTADVVWKIEKGRVAKMRR